MKLSKFSYYDIGRLYIYRNNHSPRRSVQEITAERQALFEKAKNNAKEKTHYNIEYPSQEICNKLSDIKEICFVPKVKYNRSTFRNIISNFPYPIKIVRNLSPQTWLVYQRKDSHIFYGMRFEGKLYCNQSGGFYSLHTAEPERRKYSSDLELVKKLEKYPNHTKFISVEHLDKILREENVLDIPMDSKSYLELLNKLISEDQHINTIAYQTIAQVPTKYVNSINLFLRIDECLNRSRNSKPVEYTQRYKTYNNYYKNLGLGNFNITQTFEEDIENVYVFFESDTCIEFLDLPSFASGLKIKRPAPAKKSVNWEVSL